jgi:hypothetical protein
MRAMASFENARVSAGTPRVGRYARGNRLRTTQAGTWFPGIGPQHEPVGLLLIHPGIELTLLRQTVARLVEIDLSGIPGPDPTLLQQAGRYWLITSGAPVPTLAEVLDSGIEQRSGTAAALLIDIASTVRATHAAGIVHGGLNTQSVLIGPAGNALVTDWSTNAAATTANDVSGWVKLVTRLTERWCVDRPTDAALLMRAADVATSGGWDASIHELVRLAVSPDRDGLAQFALDRITKLDLPALVGPAHPTPVGSTLSLLAQPVSEPAKPAGPRPPAQIRPVQEISPTAARRIRQPILAAPPAVTISTTDARRDPPTTKIPVPMASKPPRRPESGHRTRRVPPLTALSGLILAQLLATIIVLMLLHLRGSAVLQADSLEIKAMRTGTTCTLTAVVGTNGGGGTLVYQWSGVGPNEPVLSVSVNPTALTGTRQINLGRVWTPRTPPVSNAAVTLQLIQPNTRRASIQPARYCT